MTDFDSAGDILRAWGSGLRPDPDLTVPEWADRRRMLSGRASAEPGRYRTVCTTCMRGSLDRLSPGDQLHGTDDGIFNHLSAEMAQIERAAVLLPVRSDRGVFQFLKAVFVTRRPGITDRDQLSGQLALQGAGTMIPTGVSR